MVEIKISLQDNNFPGFHDRLLAVADTLGEQIRAMQSMNAPFPYSALQTHSTLQKAFQENKGAKFSKYELISSAIAGLTLLQSLYLRWFKLRQDQVVATEILNIARDIQEDSERTISDEQQLEATPAAESKKELFDREQFQTLRSGELESVFLDIWCLRLNQLDLNRGVDKPKRIFFSTQAFIQLDSPSDWAKHDEAQKQLDFE
nr:protein BTR1-like isoform X1 [Ipomoea batatas]